MTIKVPKYFTRFRCIAEKCRDNCCIGWKIVIDDELVEKYKNLGGAIGERLEKNIVCEENTRIFKLDRDGRCPMLNSCGLCDIIIEHGEDYLCEICREHPRYYNVFRGLCEGGIGMACESAAVLILESSDDEFIEIESVYAECEDEYSDEVLQDTVVIREELLCACGDSKNFDERALLNVARELDGRHGFGDDRCEPIDTPNAIEAVMALPPFNDKFSAYLRLARDSAGGVSEFIKSEGQLYFMRLLRYFIRRHFINSVYMVNPLATLRMCIASAKVIVAIYLARGGNRCVDVPLLAECAKDYSKSVEYNPDNIYDLIDTV